MEGEDISGWITATPDEGTPSQITVLGNLIIYHDQWITYDRKIIGGHGDDKHIIIPETLEIVFSEDGLVHCIQQTGEIIKYSIEIDRDPYEIYILNSEGDPRIATTSGNFLFKLRTVRDIAKHSEDGVYLARFHHKMGQYKDSVPLSDYAVSVIDTDEKRLVFIDINKNVSIMTEPRAPFKYSIAHSKEFDDGWHIHLGRRPGTSTFSKQYVFHSHEEKDSILVRCVNDLSEWYISLEDLEFDERGDSIIGYASIDDDNVAIQEFYTFKWHLLTLSTRELISIDYLQKPFKDYPNPVSCLISPGGIIPMDILIREINWRRKSHSTMAMQRYSVLPTRDDVNWDILGPEMRGEINKYI
jgi:hypothetical protein